VQPFPLRVQNRSQWYFACHAEHRNKPKIKRFEDWLAKQVAADPALEALKETGKAA
jgi:DNA-binding transcriptional LysR family regulator